MPPLALSADHVHRHPQDPSSRPQRYSRRVGLPLLTLVLTAAAAPATGQTPTAQPPAAEAPAAPNHRVTALEIGTVMAAGLGIYIYKGERNAYDWPLSWERVGERFTTLNQVRFDDNEFAMNNVAHPVAGALYYRFARSNGFGPVGASLYSIAGSTFWEVVVELREIVSLNDVIATPTTGIALGEALHQHTEFYRRGAPGLRNSLLEKAFSGPILVNRLFGEEAPRRADALTRYGLPADRAHRIRVHVGPMLPIRPGSLEAVPETGQTVLDRSTVSWMATVGASSEISMVEPPDAGGAEETAALPLTRLDLRFAFTETRPTELDFQAETVFDGWRRAELRHDDGGGVRGYRWFLGPATAFTTRLDHTPGSRWMEMMSTAHVLGLRADGVLRGGPWRLRWTGSAYGDFSSIRPLALDAFMLRTGGLPVGHSVLHRNQYYYAHGTTLRSRLELDMGPVGLRGEIDRHAFEPFRAPHREHPRYGADDLPMADRRSYARAWLEIRPAPGLQLAAGVEEWRGRGRMGEHVSRGGESRFMLRLTAGP